MSSIKGIKAPTPPPPPPTKAQPVKAEAKESASSQRVETARGEQQARESQPVSNGPKVGTRLNVTA